MDYQFSKDVEHFNGSECDTTGRKFIRNIRDHLQSLQMYYIANNPESFESHYYPDTVVEIAN